MPRSPVNGHQSAGIGNRDDLVTKSCPLGLPAKKRRTRERRHKSVSLPETESTIRNGLGDGLIATVVPITGETLEEFA